MPHRWFMSPEAVAAAQGHAEPLLQTERVPALTPMAMLAWAVGIPILWGVWMTLAKVAVLFR